jgi:hypothetical protein
MRVAISALAAAVLAGCGGGSFTEQEKRLRNEMVLYFAELNAQAGANAQDLKATKSDVDISPPALITYRYDWDIAGNVYNNVVCANNACGAKIGILTNPGTGLRCPACNTDLAEEMTRIGRAQPMFEVRSTTTPILVIVRYVRHTLAHDPSSAVMVSAKTETTHSIKPLTDLEPRGRGAYYAGGFYRETASALCTAGFVYKGGDLHQMDPATVEKMTKDPPETPSVSSMKLGRWGAIEQPIMPWIGRPPIAKEAPKSP